MDPQLHTLIIVFSFLAGLCIGSFLNVVGLRFLADEAIVNPPSHCPQCKAPIEAKDKIPVLSFMMLGGACRSCHAPISIQYPLIELATGALFALTIWQFGLSWQSLFLLFLICNLVVIFITDLRESLIFQINSLSLVPVGLLYNALNLGNAPGVVPFHLGALAFSLPQPLISALIAVVAAVVFFEGLILLSQALFGTEGFGHGDTHLMMGAGAFLGWPLMLLSLLLGFVAQCIPSIPMLVIQWIRNKQWVSLGSGALAIVFCFVPLLLIKLETPFPWRMYLSLASVLLSFVALIVFLRQVRQAQTFTYLPLGPALIIGILVSVFWGQDLLSWYLQLVQRS